MWQLRTGLREYSESTNHAKSKEEKHTHRINWTTLFIIINNNKKGFEWCSA